MNPPICWFMIPPKVAAPKCVWPQGSPRAVLAVEFIPTHWNAATVLFWGKKEGLGMMKCWCLGNCGVTQSTKEQLNHYLQLNRSQLRKQTLPMEFENKCKKTTRLLGYPGFLGPYQLEMKTREALAEVCSWLVWGTWCERKGSMFPKVGFE